MNSINKYFESLNENEKQKEQKKEIKTNPDRPSAFESTLNQILYDVLPREIGVYPSQSTVNAVDEMKKKVEELNNTDGFVDVPEFEDLEVTKLDTTGASDEEIKKSATDKYAEYAVHSKNAIVEEAEGGKANYENSKNDIAEKKYQSELYVDSLAKDSAENVSKEALKRGLARSSIVINKLAEIDKEKADKLSAINESYLKEINDANLKIAELENKKNVALQNLEATLATKIAIEIADLTKVRDEKIEEAIKYNNTLDKAVAEYNLAKEKAIADIKNTNTDTIKDEIGIKNSYEYNEYLDKRRYEVIKEYLYGLSKTEALLSLRTDSYYKSTLSDYYYNLLEAELKGR